MDFIPIDRTFDYSQGTTLQELDKTLVKGDTGAHKINVTVKRSGTPVDLSGLTCSGIFVNSKKHTIPVTGSVAGNVASVELSAGCYAVTGPLLMMLQLNDGSTDTTIFYAYTTVQDGATDVYYDPDAILPSLREVIENLVLCGEAASLANTKAALADEKATLANTKAALADEKAAIADAAAEEATEAALLARAAALATADGAAPMLANYLAGENLNYAWLQWGTENKTIDGSGAIIDPPSGDYRVSEPRTIDVGDYLYFDGGTYPLVALYKVSDDSYISTLGAGLVCGDAGEPVYFRVTDELSALPTKVSHTQNNANAATDEYALFDRNLLAIPIHSDITGINYLSRERADYDAASGSPPSYYVHSWYSQIVDDLVTEESYFFLRFQTPTDEVLSFDPAILFGNDSGAIAMNKIIGQSDNCVLARYEGNDALGGHIWVDCHLYNIKDSLGADYTDGEIRCAQINFINTTINPALLWDTLVSGNSIRNLTQKYVDYVALQSDVSSVKLAVQNGYTSFPFNADDWEQGSINTSTGDSLNAEPYYSNSLRLMTFIDGDVDIAIARPGYLVYFVYKYESDGTYITYIDNQASTYSGFEAGYKYRLIMVKDTLTTITPAEYVNMLLLSGKAPMTKEPFQYGNIRFTVSVNQTFDNNNDTTASAQDSESMADVDCLLRLPDTYTPGGAPTKLVFTGHGAGSWIAGGGTGSMDEYDFLLDAGYALFDVNGANNNNPSSWGSPRATQAAYKAYRYIVDNYNVDPLIFVTGGSMGGICAINFANIFPEIVRCVGVFCSTLNQTTVTIASTPYAGVWELTPAEFAAEFGFEVVAGERDFELTTNAVIDDTVSIGGETFQAVASSPTGNQFVPGATEADSAAAIAAAMAANSTLNAIYTITNPSGAIIKFLETAAGGGDTPGDMTYTGTVVVSNGTPTSSDNMWDDDRVRGYNPFTARAYVDGNADDCIMFPCPIKLWHGLSDPVIPYQISEEWVARVKRSGIDCRLRQLTGVAHEVTTAMKTECLYWFNRFS